jgi:hypothetical protein
MWRDSESWCAVGFPEKRKRQKKKERREEQGVSASGSAISPIN